MWKNTLINMINMMYSYVQNDKNEMKYSKFAKHSEARKQLKDNIYAEGSEAENFF